MRKFVPSIERPFDVAEWGDRVIVYENQTAEEIMRLYPKMTKREAQELADAIRTE